MLRSSSTMRIFSATGYRLAKRSEEHTAPGRGILRRLQAEAAAGGRHRAPAAGVEQVAALRALDVAVAVRDHPDVDPAPGDAQMHGVGHAERHVLAGVRPPPGARLLPAR